MRRRLRTIGWASALAVVLTVALLGAHALHLVETRNLAAIVPGEAYRSAQPEAADIARWKRELGIASILNLRGAAPGAGWYEAEVAEAGALGIAHADLAMSSSRAIGQREAEALIAVMERLPKPILIHCEHGANRTGLAAALYLARIAGADEETAEAALSLRYGHVAVPYLSGAWPMDASFEALEPWLGYENS